MLIATILLFASPYTYEINHFITKSESSSHIKCAVTVDHPRSTIYDRFNGTNYIIKQYMYRLFINIEKIIVAPVVTYFLKYFRCGVNGCKLFVVLDKLPCLMYISHYSKLLTPSRIIVSVARHPHNVEPRIHPLCFRNTLAFSYHSSFCHHRYSNMMLRRDETDITAFGDVFKSSLFDRQVMLLIRNTISYI